MPYGRDGICGCPPGSSWQPAAIRAGCWKAKQDGISKDVIREQISRHIKAINGCFERELKDNDQIKGRVMIRFSVRADGSVTTARIASASLAKPDAQRCFLDVFHTIRFPPPVGGYVSVDYPLVLIAR